MGRTTTGWPPSRGRTTRATSCTSIRTSSRRRALAALRAQRMLRPGGLRRMSWRIHGTYFESCNCDAICPCRRIDGVPGGRSTYGECLGVLSWVIEEGRADEVSLGGLNVALVARYHDDEPGSP